MSGENEKMLGQLQYNGNNIPILGVITYVALFHQRQVNFTAIKVL